MIEYIIDFLVIIVFVSLVGVLWVYSKKQRSPQLKLLLRAISLFILLHLIIFPVIYVFIINRNTQSIKIEENIISYERDIKLEEAKKLEKEFDSTYNSQEQKIVINTILKKNEKVLQSLDWNNIDNRKIVFLDSNLIKGYTQLRMIPGDQVHKVITVFDQKGEKEIEFKTFSEATKLYTILTDHLDELNSEKDVINERIEIIESNAFWNYRQILPYTLNILFNDNFNPQSRTANIIYFIHNILVVGFLLTFIISLFQYSLLEKKDE